MDDNSSDKGSLDIIKPAELEELNKRAGFFKAKSGYRTAYYEYGDPDGRPVIFYHGTGSHVHVMLIHNAALKYSFRIIVPDRPGVCLSDFKPGWTLLDYTRDISDLADYLGVKKFGAIGISGGGPSLMATAFSIPDRLDFVVDLACAMPLYRDREMIKYLGTMDRFYARIGAQLPLWLFKIPFSILGLQQKLLKNPKMFARMMSSSMCASDGLLFEHPDLQYLFMRDFQELFRQGAKGPSYDAQLVYRDWGFRLEDIKTHIEVFHGTDDKWVPFVFSEYLAKTAADVRLNPIKGEGHFCHLVYADNLMSTIRKLFAG
jgi:pimeloyl-ACP methyl ester carboxylesterase